MNENLETTNKDHSPIMPNVLGDEIHEIPPEELSFFFQQLHLPGQHENEAKYLAEYFKDNPFRDEYNLELIFSLMNFFDPNSKFGIDGVNIALRIINSLFRYNKNHRTPNNPVFSELMNQPFYVQIWPYFLRSKYAISIFDSILAIQRPRYHISAHKSHEDEKPKMRAIDFLIEVQIFEEIKKILKTDFVYMKNIYSLFQKFRFYPECYANFREDIQIIIDSICLLTFSGQKDDESKYYGYKCLGSFGRFYSEIGKQIMNNENFKQAYERIETLDEDSIECILDMINDILLNHERIEEKYSLTNPGSLIRKSVVPLNPMILNGIFKLTHLPNLTNDVLLRLLSVLSHLFLTIEEINLCIKTEFSKFVFDIISGDFQFKVKREAIAALCALVSSGNKETIGFFIDNNFVGIIGDFIDNLMNDIPHEILDAFDEIILNSEMNEEECSQWSTLVFNNENIVDALEKASNNEYLFEDDFDKYSIPLCEHAKELLYRVNNIE